MRERAVRQERVGWAEGTQAILHIHSAGKQQWNPGKSERHAEIHLE